MRVGLVIAVATAAAVLLGLAWGKAEEDAQQHARPALKLAGSVPLVVRGSGFRAGEHVRVTAAERRKRVVAGHRGTFEVRFPGMFERCLGVVVTAVGDRGSHARLKPPEALCPPNL